MKNASISRIAAAGLALCLSARALADDGQKHTVVTGDHLWGLAQKYCGDHFKWRVLHKANEVRIKDPHWIYPGQVFDIPTLCADLGPAAPEEPTEAAAPAEEEPGEEEAQPRKAAAPVVESPAPPQSEDLSTKLPPALNASDNSAPRFEMPKGWKEDGKIIEFEGREGMAAQGDLVSGKLSGKLAAAPGQRFTVYRPSGIRELDENPKALHLQRIGVVEVQEEMGKAKYRFKILKSGDSVQLGDLLKREG